MPAKRSNRPPVKTILAPPEAAAPAAAKKGARPAKAKPAAEEAAPKSAKRSTAAKKGATTKRPAAGGAGGRSGLKLVIVESPAKARTIAKYLGSGFEVRASNGHVRDLPKSKLGVDVESGFAPSYVLIKGKGNIVKDLKSSARRAAMIYLAPDPDREGEAIAWHLAETLGEDETKVQRLAFYEITKRGIEEALTKPRTIDMAKVQAQQARRVLDRLVGYKVSPYLWKTVRYGLSAGRVQSVALRLICEREDEIRAFVPQEYWTIDVDLETPAGEIFRARLQRKNGEKVALTNEGAARAEAAELERATFSVASLRTQEKKRNPMAPFITSTLQQEAFRRHRFSAQKTMVLAQQLYEGIDLGAEGATGLITYMRTDSTRVSPDAIAEVRNFIQHTYGAPYLPDEPRQYRSRETSQDAHESVRPTSVARTPASMRSHLEPDQYKLYELVWQRFVASQMNPALVLTTTAEIAAGPFLLRASGSRVKFDGFARAYATALIEDAAEGDAKNKLPALAEGDALASKGVLPEQHFTEPPPHYTEATLVKTLEEKGIGRPSTYATIVGTILTRDYVTRDRGKLVPTELGMTVWKLLGKAFADVFDVAFTAKLEGRLDHVETGQEPWADVVSEFYEPFEKDLAAAEATQAEVRASLAQETDKECPKCGSKMVKKFGRNGPFLACPRYPECKTTMPLEDEVPTEAPNVPCPTCGGPMRVRTGRFGKFLACQNYPDCKGTRPFTLQIPCPECGKGELVERRTRRGKNFYGCSNYPNCTFGLWDKPLKEACPACAYPILVQKHTKTKGDYKQCPKCKAKFGDDGSEEGAEELSGTVDR